MAIDLSKFLASMNTGTANIQGAIDAIVGGGSAVDASYSQSIDSGTRVADNAALVTKTKQDAEVAAQLSLENFSLRGKTDINDVSGTQAMLAELYASQRLNLAGLHAGIQEKLAVDPMEDPLAWISGKLTVDRDIAVYNAKEVESEATRQTVVGMNQLVDVRSSALDKLKRTATAASALAATELVRDQAMLQVQGLQREQLIAGTNRAKDIASMSVMQTAQYHNAVSVDMQMEQLQTSRERMAMERVNHQRIMDKASDDDLALSYVIDRIKLGVEIANPGNPAAMDGLDPKSIRLFAQGKIKDPKIQEYFTVGADNWGLGKPGTVRVIGLTPAEAFQRVSIIKPVLTPAAQSAYDKIIVEGVSQAKLTDAYKQAEAAKDVATMQKVINTIVAARVKSDFANPESPSSIAYLPPIMGLFDVLPKFKQTEIFQNVLGPAEAAGKTFPDAASVISYMQTEIQKGKISPNTAMTELASLYRAAQEFSLESKQARQLGLLGKDTPVSYVADVTGFNLGGTHTKVDMTNRLEVGKALMLSRPNYSTPFVFGVMP